MPDLFWMSVAWGVILALLGALLAIMQWETRKFRHWHSTEGKIIAAGSTFQSNRPHDSNYDSSDSELLNVPHVEFEYMVGQETLRGSRISVVVFDPRYHSAKTILARYPVGKIVPVFYDPADPRSAALERTFPRSDYLLFVWLAAISLLGAWLIAVYFCQVYLWVKPRLGASGGAQFVTAIIGFGSFFVLLSVGAIGTVLKSWLWPSTTGRIESSSVASFRVYSDEHVRTAYKPRVLYTYEVDGKIYTGDRLNFSFVLGGTTQGRAKRIAGRYQPREPVRVYYNRRNPADSVLRRTGSGIVLFPILAAIFLAFAWALMR